MRLVLAIFGSILIALAPAWAQDVCAMVEGNGSMIEAGMSSDAASMDCADSESSAEGEADMCALAMTLVCTGALSVPGYADGVVPPITLAGDNTRGDSGPARAAVPDFDTPPPRV